ncbi:MAG: double-strand break repair protein AddB [Rhizobiaceae bacterium]
MFSIPPGCNFLRTIARALLDGELVAGFEPHKNPLLLSTATIYVPTRRAARGLAAEFLSELGSEAAILPSIRTLGDADEEELLFESGEVALDFHEPMLPLERKFLLFQMVQSWTTALSKDTIALFGDEDIIIPSSPADAMWLAGDLGQLMDQMETEEISWNALLALVPDDYAQWWQLTLSFLNIAMEHWPEVLKEKGRIDPAKLRGMILDQRTKQYKERTRGPVIAAGSTGTIPATGRLLAAIAGLEQGALILPGLDLEMDGDDWKNLLHRRGSTGKALDEPITAPSQPQYGLAKLIEKIGIERDQVKILGFPDTSAIAREKLVSLAMLPAEATDKWNQISQIISPEMASSGLASISIIEAPGERQEALAIALALRESLKDEGKTTALVTPDRVLGRRVAVELQRFGIEVDDSGGTSLRNSDVGVFLRLLQDVCFGNCTAVNLVSLLKHPLFRAGYSVQQVQKLAQLFELALVRGVIHTPVPGNFGDACAHLMETGASKHYLSQPVRRMSEDDWQQLLLFCRQIDNQLKYFSDLSNSVSVHPLSEIFEKLNFTAIDLASELIENESVHCALDDATGGAEFKQFFADIKSIGTETIELRTQDFATVFEATVGDVVMRSVANTHPRLHILGPLEARLLKLDRVILGGLNEGGWPPNTRNDPFLNRVMRAELTMAPPERRVGLAAHDFQQFMGCDEIILSRSQRVDNAPTIASRWLQRLLAVAGRDHSSAMVARGNEYLGWVKQLDKNDGMATASVRPNPKPPVALRPTSMAVTDIETWIRDPYAIYAKHVLKLRQLPELERVSDPALKGTLYHEILAKYLSGIPDPSAQNALEQLMEIARAEFSTFDVPDDVAALWLPRFAEIARLYLAWEAPQNLLTNKVYCEVDGEIEVGNFTLRARADRVDITEDGRISVFDYKSGNGPSKREAKTLSPQLPLEGAIALVGGFSNTGKPKELSELAFIRLRLNDDLKVDELGDNKESAQEISQNALLALKTHIKAYENPSQGYLSRYAPKWEVEFGGDYDHLARVREWSIGDPEDSSDG